MDAVNNLPINVLDIAVLLILLISAILAYARGFVHEVLSIGGWIGAIFATIYGFPYAKPIAREYLGFGVIDDFVAAIAIFIVTLVFLSLITHAIAKQVKSSALNVLDRSLGFLFGLARGALVVCAAYIVLELLLPEAEHPQFVREARTIELIKPGAHFLKAVVPDYISVPNAGGSRDGSTSPLPNIDVDRLLSPEPRQQDTTPQEGYDANQRKEMERLIDGTGSN